MMDNRDTWRDGRRVSGGGGRVGGLRSRFPALDGAKEVTLTTEKTLVGKLPTVWVYFPETLNAEADRTERSLGEKQDEV